VTGDQVFTLLRLGIGGLIILGGLALVLYFLNKN
jgi:hypothetical protein